MTESGTDQELLRKFAERGSESAFQSLVQRHVNLVFATALRGIGDAAAAQEVTQNVFIALARKAAWLRGEVALAGWLHKTALLEARQWWRGELRRKRREETAAALGTTMNADDSLLKSLTGLLDEGLLELREADRQALMLRYLEDRSHREVGAQLGIGEDAARKRIDKALDQLTRFFQRRGYSVPAAATTATVLRSASTHAAPAGAAAAITKAAVSAGGATSLGTVGIYFAKFMGLTKTQTAAICLAVAAAPVAYEWQAAASARSEQKSLRAQLAQVHDDIALQQRELERFQRRLRSTDFALAQVRANAARQNVVAAAEFADPQLYLWDEASEYIRLPKEMLQRLTFSGVHNAPESKRTQDPVSIRNGTLSMALAQALGVTPEEEARLRENLLGFYHDYQQLDQAFTYATNQPPPGFGMQVGDNEFYTLVTSRFPEHGETLKHQLRSGLESTLGKERTDVVWQQAEREMREQLNDFGELEHWQSVVLYRDDNRIGHWKAAFRPGEKNPVYSSGGHGPIDRASVPEVFRPIVDEWKNRFKPQTVTYE